MTKRTEEEQEVTETTHVEERNEQVAKKIRDGNREEVNERLELGSCKNLNVATSSGGDEEHIVRTNVYKLKGNSETKCDGMRKTKGK